MARKLVLSAILLAVTLVTVQPVLAAVARHSQPFSSAAFVRGSLQMTASTREAVLVGRALAPGDTARGSVTIANGSVAGRYSLSAHATGSSALARMLQITVIRASDGAQLYAGSLSGLHDVDLGRLAGGEAATYVLQAELARSAGNALQGLAAGASFTWSATQA